MNIRKILGHRSLLAQFLLFYLLILLVPIVICGLMYLRSLDIIRQEIDNSNAAVLEKIRLTIDSRLTDLENTTLAFNFDTNVTRLVFTREINADDRLMMAKVIKSLANVTSSNQFVKSLSLYLRNTDIVLTPINSMNAADFFNAYSDPLFHDEKWSGRQVKLSLDNSLVSTTQATGKLTLAYFRSLPLGEINGSQGLLGILLDPAEINAVLTRNSEDDSGLFLINDEAGRYYSPQAEQIDVGAVISQMQPVNTVQYLDISGSKVAVSQNQSTQFGLRYLSITPIKVYNRRIDSIRNLYLLSLLGCCLLGGLLAVYFARRNYNPVKEIVDNIAGKPGAVRRNYNEYDIIRESIRRIIGENDDTRKLVRKQKLTLKNTFLTSLVKGSQNDSQYIADGLTFFDINFPHPGFAVLVCSLDRYAVSKRVQDKSIVMTKAEERFGQLGQCLTIESDEGAILLMNLPEHTDDDALKQAAAHLIHALQMADGIVLTVAISAICHSPDLIGEAYREAEHALEYRILAGSGSAISFPDIKRADRSSQTGNRPPHDSQQLANSLRSGDINAARTILRSIINDEFYTRSLTIPIAKCKMSVLVDTMMTAIEDMPTGSSAATLDKSACIEALLACKTIDALRQTMEDVLDQIEDFMIQSKTSKCESLKQDILAYIADHYRELDFNVSNVAYHFGMSIDGISRFFKKQMNTGLLTFINEQRIEQALHLLDQGLSIKTVAESVGFSNSDAFIRVFKKVKGTTPGKFREIQAERRTD